MKLLTECILCGSSELKPHSMRYRPGYPHISRVKCNSCNAVFANPIATEDELVKFYQNYYDKGTYDLVNHKEHHEKRFEEIRNLSEKHLRNEFEYVLKYKKNGNFLDIGFGLGEPLFLASRLGFKVYGTEYDSDAIKFLSRHIPNVAWHNGGILDSDFKHDSFDFIRFWHVIEHVLSPRDYIREIKKLLKPDGILMIGTPNISSNGYGLYRSLKYLSLSIPGIVDGMEHTVLFNKKTLSKLLEDEGFEVIEHYTHSHIENYKKLISGDLPAWKKLVRLLQSIFHVSQTLYAKRLS